MAYELIYTRSIASDDRVRFTDVPITSPSIMVDVLSLRSPFYRIAGYAYSIVSDGLIDYERGEGYTLPFGKNRLLFPSTVLPYYLEFFPKWGTTQAIISVYTGSPSPPPPPGGWKPMANFDIEFRLAQNPNRIEYRQPIGSSVIRTMAAGAIQGCFSPTGYVGWKTSGPAGYAYVPEFPAENFDSDEAHSQFMAAPSSIIL